MEVKTVSAAEASTGSRTMADVVALGAERGDKVAILSHTRAEWTVANFGILGAGATSVSIYQTNSPEECHYVLEHSESRGVVCEDATQLAKIRQIEGDLPKLEWVFVMDPSGASDPG